jgi:hypothetical protein
MAKTSYSAKSELLTTCKVSLAVVLNRIRVAEATLDGEKKSLGASYEAYWEAESDVDHAEHAWSDAQLRISSAEYDVKFAKEKHL